MTGEDPRGDQAHLPAEQARAKAPARLSRADVHQGGPQSAVPPPGARPQAPFGLNLIRLKTRAEFIAVRKGARAGRPLVVVEARRRAETGPVGLGFTATKKIGSAVTRNRAKRRLRAAAAASTAQFAAGCDYVLIARDATADAPWPSLLDDVGKALIRLRPALEGVFAAPGGPLRRPSRIKTDTD